MTRHYLSLQEVAARLGVTRNTIAKYRLPDADVVIGSGTTAWRGWSPTTIDRWAAGRRGRGRRHEDC